MARTYLSGTNSRGSLVTASNSKYCHLRGWNAGVMIYASVDDKDKDVFRIYMSGGSNGGSREICLGAVTETDDGPKWTPYYEIL